MTPPTEDEITILFTRVVEAVRVHGLTDGDAAALRDVLVLSRLAYRSMGARIDVRRACLARLAEARRRFVAAMLGPNEERMTDMSAVRTWSEKKEP